MKNIVKICECGAPVETRSNGFEYDQCYECWWKKDPRNPKNEEKPQGAEWPPHLNVEFLDGDPISFPLDQEFQEPNYIEKYKLTEYLSLTEHEHLLNEVYAKCPNEEWECTKVQRKLEAQITSLEAMLAAKDAEILRLKELSDKNFRKIMQLESANKGGGG